MMMLRYLAAGDARMQRRPLLGRSCRQVALSVHLIRVEALRISVSIKCPVLNVTHAWVMVTRLGSL
jgi:hypothetical protein